MTDSQKRIKELEEEVAQLREENERTNLVVTAGWSISKWFAVKTVIGGDVYSKWIRLWEAWEAEGRWPKDETKEFTGSLWNRYTKIGWLMVAAALFPALFTGFQLFHMAKQTELIARQEQIIKRQSDEMKRQNHYAAFEQTIKFRDMLMKDKAGFIPKPGNYWPHPNMSVVRQIITLGKSEMSDVSKAIEPLLSDENHTVSLGAALIYKELGLPIIGADLSQLRFRDAMFIDATFEYCDFRSSHFPYNSFGSAKFLHCELDETIFENQSAQESIFIHCSLDRISARGYGAFKDSIFYNCSLEMIELFPIEAAFPLDPIQAGEDFFEMFRRGYHLEMRTFQNSAFDKCYFEKSQISLKNPEDMPCNPTHIRDVFRSNIFPSEVILKEVNSKDYPMPFITSDGRLSITGKPYVNYVHRVKNSLMLHFFQSTFIDCEFYSPKWLLDSISLERILYETYVNQCMVQGSENSDCKGRETLVQSSLFP